MKKHEIYYGIAFWLLLLYVGFLYIQGISPALILDDEANLSGLAQIYPDNYLLDSLNFILHGTSGPLGRPISLFSFALQSYAWPQANDFKYVNICLHLLIASLIFWLLIRLGRLLKIEQKFWLALCLISVAIWLSAPLQVSTVFYVVQRMTQLAALFAVLSFLLYLYGRQALLEQKTIKGFIWMSLGIGGCGTLAILSKENAALIPIFVLVLEFTLLQALTRPRIWHYWASIFLYTPALFILFYLLFMVDPVQSYASAHRDFTYSERLMSEARIVLEYLQKLFIPLPNQFGLFQDGYAPSTSLLNPPSTLLSIILIISSAIAALFIRKRYPMVAFGILWFYAGHLIESTTLPLILYFEHRNYLAILGPIVAAVYLTMRLYQNTQLSLAMRRFVLAASMGWLIFNHSVLWGEIKVWRDPLFQAVYWAEQKPYSRYAQTHAALTVGQLGHLDKALTYYQHMARTFPQEISPYLMWLRIHCLDPKYPAPSQEKILYQARHGHFDYGLGNVLHSLQEYLANSSCTALGDAQIDTLFQTLFENPNLVNEQRLLRMIYSNLLWQRKDAIAALNQLEKILKAPPSKNDTDAQFLRLYILLALHQYPLVEKYLHELHNTLPPVKRFIYSEQLASIAQRLAQHQSQNSKKP